MMKPVMRMSVAAALLGCIGAAAAGNAEILGGLEAARERVAQAEAGQSPLQKALLACADFEETGTLYVSGAGSVAVPLAAEQYREGRHGRGFFFEKPRQNLLPPELADVERDITGFIATGEPPAQLGTTTDQALLGTASLNLKANVAGAGFATRPVKVNATSVSWHEKTWTLMASCSVRGPQGTRVRLDVTLVPATVKPETLHADRKTAGPQNPDSAAPQEIQLTGGWQRIACTVSGDARLREREAVLKLTLVSGPAELAVDGFQFEQVDFYPHHHRMPTTWTPGCTSVPASSVEVPALKKLFPTREGAVAFWTRTPRVSNLDSPGGCCWFSYGAGWNPCWMVGEYNLTAGGDGNVYNRAVPALDGKWHHVLFTWDATSATLFLDGVATPPFERKAKDLSAILETYGFRLGGSVQDGQAANAVMDEFCLFSRVPTPAEVASLAGGEFPAPVRPALELGPLERSLYYRDEGDIRLVLPLTRHGSAPVTLALNWAVFPQPAPGPAAAAVLAGRVEHLASPGTTDVALVLNPGRLKAGTYVLRVGTVAGADAVYREDTISISPPLPREQFMLMSWGNGGETAAGRAFCRRVGVNTVDTYAENFEELGRAGLFYGWHCNFGKGIASPQALQEARDTIRRLAEKRRPFPNWRYVLYNSETGPGPIPGEEDKKTWFSAQVERECGFPLPAEGWRLSTIHNPVECRFPAGAKPGPDGIWRESQGFRFLDWWYGGAGGWWRLNQEAATVVRSVRPDVVNWNDPVYAAGCSVGMDAISSWSYQVAPESLVNEFEGACATARGTKREFFATLGGSYVNPLADAVEVPGRGKRHLVPTGDDLIQQAWLATTQIASDGVAYWALDLLREAAETGAKNYAEPDAIERLGREWQERLLPIGTLLKGVKNVPRAVALLLPESTLWPDAGEGGWWWGTVHYPNNWGAWLGQAGVSYDVLADVNVQRGELAAYKAILFPMAEFVRDDVYRALTQAATGGARVVVDTYGRQEYPGMERWPQEYYHKMPAAKRENYGKDTVERLKKLWQTLEPQLPVTVNGAEGAVFWNVREVSGARYVSVVNNLRQAGTYTEWTGKPEFKPYGKAQAATVRIKTPADSAIYEFTEGRKLTPQRDGEFAVVTLALPPHGGRLLCVYPRAIERVRAEIAGKTEQGLPARLQVRIEDRKGKPVPGRQLVDVRIVDAGNARQDARYYAATDGALAVPFFPALNDAPGRWAVTVTDRASGRSVVLRPKVRPAKAP